MNENYKDICVVDKQLPIQQLNKLNDKGTKREDFFPISLIQAIFDKTGLRLDTIISSFNYLFLPYKGDTTNTRLQVLGLMRRKSLVICYRDLEDNVIIEMYNSNDRGDEAWQDNNNWIRFSDFIKDAVEEVFDNIENFPNIVEIINNTISEEVNKWLNENVGDEITNIINDYIDSIDVDALIEKNILAWINDNKEYVDSKIEQYVNEYLNENLEPLVGEFFNACVTYMQDNERVIANALARHEQAITDLQSNSTE